MNAQAIKTLELQALEALRQAAETGASDAVVKNGIEAAMTAMRGAELLRPKRAKKKRR